LVGFKHHQLYSGVGADIVMESITLTTPIRLLLDRLVGYSETTRYPAAAPPMLTVPPA